MVTKQKNHREKKNDKVQATFTMPAIDGCESLCLVGDFNAWDQTLHAMHRNDDGSWSLTLELEAGRDYQFRYCGGDGTWHNDPAADAYVPNPYGSDNSVVRA